MTDQNKRDDALRRLREMPSWGAAGVDPENAHRQADLVLLYLIDDPEITEAFEAIHKWYS